MNCPLKNLAGSKKKTGKWKGKSCACLGYTVKSGLGILLR